MNKDTGKLTRKMISQALYEKHGGFTREEAHRVTNLVLELIADELISGNEVRLVNFGVFKVFENKPRVIVHPASGEIVPLKRRLTVRFTPSQTLLKKINRKP